MRIERVWAMPNKWTFQIKPIAKLLKKEVLGEWVDPYCGENSPAKITNDLNPDIKATYHLDAFDFLKQQLTNTFDGVLYDPPYSLHQSNEVYKGYTRKKVSVQKDEVARIIKPGGKALCFGWNSAGLGKTRGFKLFRVLLVNHGASHNDTIVTVERKMNGSLF